jgi:hypothetical protein
MLLVVATAAVASKKQHTAEETGTNVIWQRQGRVTDPDGNSSTKKTATGPYTMTPYMIMLTIR